MTPLTDEDLRAAAVLAGRARFPKMDGAHAQAAIELARDYVPRLLAEVRRLRAEVEHEREKTRAACEQNDGHFAQGYVVAIEEAAAVCEDGAAAIEALLGRGGRDGAAAARSCADSIRALAGKR